VDGWNILNTPIFNRNPSNLMDGCGIDYAIVYGPDASGEET
jgi:hypothetical protein